MELTIRGSSRICRRDWPDCSGIYMKGAKANNFYIDVTHAVKKISLQLVRGYHKMLSSNALALRHGGCLTQGGSLPMRVR
jgi:hypothetical protein